ncbi:sensor histidine kinase [Caenimonas terrae]|uniref:histidine kinase n=1 Tax=Caenimonas terrae TaxID=696074 RepID=A0ABW0NE24_9BURK
MATAPQQPRWTGSLRLRLLVATVCGVALAVLLAGIVLDSLFREHVLRQFSASLSQHLDQLTARLEFDAQGRPVIDPQSLSDPRWQRPYSGLYWQVDEAGGAGPGQAAVLRSRSLWDTRLVLPADALPGGAVHAHEGRGPADSSVLMLERTVQSDAQPGARWRLVVAADLHEVRAATSRFSGVLAPSLAVLLVLLALAAWAQVGIGLKPLRALQDAVQGVRQASAGRLHGRFPSEVQPLVDDFNAILDDQAAGLARARTHAGNLAHALKTPLSVIDQAAARALRTHDSELARVVQEQLGLAMRQIDWHLARSRVAATRRLPGLRTPIGPAIAGLVRVMERVHAQRGLRIRVAPCAQQLSFAGEAQDLQEMLGNLLDNACKWAAAEVKVWVEAAAIDTRAALAVHIEDDGPGIAAADVETVRARGVRADETVPGSGLGLAIVQDLVGLYGGRLDLEPAAPRGLHAVLLLPAAAVPGKAQSVNS